MADVKVALHFQARDEQPQGVWWVDPEGGLMSFYVEESPIAGRGKYLIHRKVDGVPYEAYFDQLADCTPVVDDWESPTIADDLNPVRFLELVRRIAS